MVADSFNFSIGQQDIPLCLHVRRVPTGKNIGRQTCLERTAAQLPAARECTKPQPADARRVDPGPGRPAGWEAGQS